jgi:hypothetical protein
MMAVSSNEPYSRVSQDNGVFDGALIGATVAAGGAGAGIYGARMNYKGIDKRNERDLQALNAKKDILMGSVDKIHNKFESKNEKARQGRFSDMNIEMNNEKRNKKMQKIGKKLEPVNNSLAHHNNVQGIKDSHMYSKMGGGWRKAGIIGASAVVGGGVGMIADGVNK